MEKATCECLYRISWRNGYHSILYPYNSLIILVPGLMNIQLCCFDGLS